MNQITNSVLMIRPASFRMNEQTAVNNYFQEELKTQNEAVNELAQKEFDEFVAKLRAAGVDVTVVEDDKSNDTPDAVFPNNWVSFHQNGNAAIYPMFAENRRAERREEVFKALEKKGFKIEDVVDYTAAETEHIFLEGTGSLVLDRVNKLAYCALSPRADEDLFIEFCEDFEYTPVVFRAYQTFKDERLLIYHTNVMMCIADTFAVICLDCIDDKKERKQVSKFLKQSGKEIITISEEQMHQFAGNMLQLKGENEPYLIMSAAAYNSLSDAQKKQIETHCSIIYADLTTIETCGGGSARCMIAEVFLPKTN